ncbi:hypothetical protein G8C92_16695 [Paenibacillus donghaensis]|nr:FDLD family class I lanthipeptide [Paenibacillus donghaensis]MBE9915654.1 hypothetical protein [Paenibacillus donghaensis]
MEEMDKMLDLDEMFDLDVKVQQSEMNGDVSPNTWHISILFSCTDCI